MVLAAADHLTNHHAANGILVVPADVPFIDADEIDELLSHHQAVTLLPDQNRIGTNGLTCSPPRVIEFVFDGKSFEPHLQLAKAAGITPRVVANSRSALDVDTPDDLNRLLRLGPTQTGRYLRQAGIPARLPTTD